MKKIAVSLIFCLSNSVFANGIDSGNVVLGAIVGGYVIGQVINQRPVPQPQVIYLPAPQPVPQQVCEVRIMRDQYGQMREFTACYYRY